MAAKNPYLKNAFEVHDYTIEQMREIQKCADDPMYFIRTYCIIQHPSKGAIPFALRPYQERVLDGFHNNRMSITLAPRQIGKSWLAGAYLLWWACFKEGQTIVVLSNKNDNAMEMISRCKFMYERCPHWLKPGLMQDGWNKHNLGFDNASRIISQATTENSGRGLSISLLFLDEFAFVPDSVAEEFWTSIAPTLAESQGKCIITSTPNGDVNRFAVLWRGANSRANEFDAGVNGFFPIEVMWNEPPNRDEEFKKGEIAKIGQTKWDQEYECKFISSDPTLIDQVVLATLTQITDQIEPLGKLGEYTFWEKPQPGAVYLVGVDPSTGSGDDFANVEVFSFPGMRQVAQFRSNTASPSLTYHMLKRMLNYLDEVGATTYFSIENNGIGEAVIALYEDDESPPFSAEFISEAGQGRRGMATTGKSKIKACIALKEMVERGQISFTSKVTVRELKDFVRRGGSSYAAKNGGTDDSVMAIILVVRLLQEVSAFDQAAYEIARGNAYMATDNEDGWDWDENYSDNSDDGPMGMLFS